MYENKLFFFSFNSLMIFINFQKDNNGIKKMIVGYTDRTIRCYSWQATTQTNQTSSNANNLAKNNNSQSKGSLASQVAGSYTFQENGKIIFEQSWEFSDLVFIILIFQIF